ncbi:MAG TPA: bifunctional phosphopantothenoylcysteine decarboxylase/phosphopantothenate--cysteine ligase CoaBC [Candidatus Hydrogenedens sp.]|nr:bifunctional phosphopantothenoylcysteine decarboxylase/phosphopantothenate--cysteine ligase CoaBC [Candidatus Hydrogenedens sp.]
MGSPFQNKVILLGVSGSIAAYKACELCSRLVQNEARVYVAMTENAQKLVCPVTFECLSGNPVITGMFETHTLGPLSHISLTHEVNLLIVAPATANLIAKSAHGIADDWLSTALLATTAPILWAPAMNPQMFLNPASQQNIETLKNRKHHFVGPAAGNTACGEIGIGRMVEPVEIIEYADIILNEPKDFVGKKILITSGPTQEPIDPVRYISNRSSGKMGRALAMEALRRGAEVTVISGPAREPLPFKAELIFVRTALEMYEETVKRSPQYDIFIGAAAVADYRVADPADEKHKRNGATHHLELIPNPDIAKKIGEMKRPNQITVGFAAETHHLVDYAQEKLKRKNLDLIVANQVGGENCAFGSDYVSAIMITPKSKDEKPELIPKSELTRRIFNRISEIMNKK